MALLKLSLAEVSLKEKPDSAARLGASSAPLTLVVNVCVALAVPSLTARVKLSLTLVLVPSIALSFGT